MLGGGVLDLLLDVRHDLGGPLLPAQGLADELGGVLPGRPVGHGVLGEADHGRDLGELVVVLLRQPGVGAQDDVRLERGDRLEVDAVRLGVGLRGLGAGLLERGVEPVRGAVLVGAEVQGGHPDRDHAEGGGDVVVDPGHRGHALGGLLDRGLAEGVLHGARELAGGALRGRGPAPGLPGRRAGGAPGQDQGPRGQQGGRGEYAAARGGRGGEQRARSAGEQRGHGHPFGRRRRNRRWDAR